MKKLKVILIIFLMVILQLTVSCKKEKNKMYELTINYNNEQSCEKIRVLSSTLLMDSLPIPENDNKHFGGWYLDDSFKEKVTTQTVNSNVTVYAKWLRKLEINFYNESKQIIHTETVIEDSTYVVSYNYYRPNKKFIGWYLDEDCTLPYKPQILTNNLALYGKWEETKMVNLYGKNQELLESIFVQEGSNSIDLKQYEYEGFEFIGWYLDSEFKNEYTNEQLSDNLNLYGKWEKYYFVNFYGKDDELLDSIKVFSKEIINIIKQYEYDDYEFVGWYIDNNRTQKYQEGNILGSINLYGKWNRYYNINVYGKDSELLETIKVLEGTHNIELQHYTYHGYKFIDWYLDQELKYVFKNQVILSNLDLYGKWEKIINQFIIEDEIEVFVDDEITFMEIIGNLIDEYKIDINELQLEIDDNSILEATLNGIKALDEGKSTITFSNDSVKIIAYIRTKIKVIMPNEFDKVNNEVVLKPNTTREMTNPYYWINKISNTNEIIMSSNEIASLNQKIYANSNPYNNKGTGLCDITKINSITQSEVITMINKMINSAPSSVYNSNANVNNVPKTINILYGLVINTASLKNVPTLARTGTNNKYQETGLETGEGVLIYHESTDGLWYFVQARNYYGWILKTDIALTTRDTMENYISSNEFLVVTSERITISHSINTEIRMGATIPIKSFDGEYYTIQVPTRNNNGQLELKLFTIKQEHENFSVGYLPYTLENLVKQMFKMLGQPYDWGDEYGGRDCSSTLDAAYKCFGFVMPRNTSQMFNIDGHRNDVSTMSISNKTSIMSTLNIGSIILKSGHVMMYIGEENGYHYIIHNISGGVCVSRCDQSSYGYSTYTMFIELK